MKDKLFTAYQSAKRLGKQLQHRLGSAHRLTWNLPLENARCLSRGMYLVDGTGTGTLEIECPELGPGARGKVALELPTLLKLDVPVSRLTLTAPGRTGEVTLTPLLWVEAAARAVKRHGLAEAKSRIAVLDDYTCWIETYGGIDSNAITAEIATWPSPPKISVVMPVYNTDERWLRAAIESVTKQLYTNWELCIADDASPDLRVRQILESYRDPRLKIVYRPVNGHIAAASQSALELATGEFVALLDHDDELPAHALYKVAREILAHPDVDVLYSDEDKIDEKGRRFSPHFKTEWSPDLLYSYNLMTHLSVYRRRLLDDIGGFRKGTEGSQDYDLALRACERTTPARIRHLPYVLYHWRAIPGSVALAGSEKHYAHDAARRAIRAHFARTGVRAEVEPGYGQFHRVRYQVSELPRVEVIIPTRDAKSLVEAIAEDVLDETDYPQLRLTIVDNGSSRPETLEFFKQLKRDWRVSVLRVEREFNFSALNNAAVAETEAPVLAFLNNDLEIRNPDWLKEMVSFALQPGIGAVGARLLYPDGRVQHAGVLLGLNGGIADHAHRFIEAGDPGYFSRARVSQEFSCVTAACLVMRREVFVEVGGFDEALAVAYNDVDLCLRIREKGYRVVWTPYAELFHKESATRGSDTTAENRARLDREAAYLRARWGKALAHDPFHNPNLSLQGSGFSLAFPPRVLE